MKSLKEKQERYKKSLRRGEDVRIIGGKNKGIVGILCFIKETSQGVKVGVFVDEEKFYTDLNNIERENKIPFSEAYDDFEQEYVC